MSFDPNISAPGVNVRSSVDGGGYANFNGTSMAAPHVAGAVALMWSRSAGLIGAIDTTRGLLDGTAIDVNATTCGGTTADNNVFGEGRLDALAAVTATPPPAPRSISVNDVTVAEGNAGQATATLTVTASPATGSAVTFDYATATGTAVAPTDYAEAAGPKTIVPTASTTTIEVPVNGDEADEADEAFSLNLSNVNAPNAIGDGTGQVTIADEDNSPNTLIDAGPKKKTKKKKAKFRFSSNESPVAFQCKLDSGSFEACTSAAKFKVKKGKHELHVRAIDAANNVDPTPASYSWKVRKKRKRRH